MDGLQYVSCILSFICMELSKNKLRKILQEEKLFFDFIEVEYVVNDFDLHFRCFEGEILSYFDWNYIMTAILRIEQKNVTCIISNTLLQIGDCSKYPYKLENKKTELLKLIIKFIKTYNRKYKQFGL